MSRQTYAVFVTLPHGQRRFAGTTRDPARALALVYAGHPDGSPLRQLPGDGCFELHEDVDACRIDCRWLHQAELTTLGSIMWQGRKRGLQGADAAYRAIVEAYLDKRGQATQPGLGLVQAAELTPK